MNRIRTFFLIFLILFMATGIKASTDQDLKGLNFSSINLKSGLPHSSIECILKDKDGFMWFGTRNGLCRFDGYEITTFQSTDDSTSIAGNRILSIAEDFEGNIWAGTYNNGLCLLNKRKGVFTRFKNNNNFGERINKIKILADSSIWIASNKGLANFNPKNREFKVYRPQPGNSKALPSKDIYEIFESSDGSIYVTCESPYLFRFDRQNENFIPLQYKRDPELKDNYNKQIAEDNSGVLWISAPNHGLCSYNPKTSQSEIFRQGNQALSTEVLTGDITKAPDGRLWICTDGSGINILDPISKKFTYLNSKNSHPSLSSNTFYTAYFDTEGIIWLGSFDNGVYSYNPQQYKFTPTLYKSGDLSYFENKSILSIHQDLKKNIWLGTDGDGLFCLHPNGKIDVYQNDPSTPNSISSNVITSIAEGPKGQLLIGTFSGGLNSFDIERKLFTHYLNLSKEETDLKTTSIWTILKDSRNLIWLGLLADGLAQFDTQTETFLNLGPSSHHPFRIDFPNVMTITEDTDGDVWFGTEGKGIFILDRQTHKLIKPIDDHINHIFSNGIIKCIFQDKNETVWIGTEGKGLYQYHKNKKKLVQFENSHELPSTIIQSIAEDKLGNLWVGTNKGLSKIDGRNHHVITFLDSDGLSGIELNQEAFLEMEDGRILIGTKHGLDVINPEKININTIVPDVVFTHFSVMNQEIKPGDRLNKHVIVHEDINVAEAIQLSNREKSFVIEFAALNFTLPEKCNYAYMLEGYDETWNYTNYERRFAAYSNLPPDTYVFKVKASNNDNLWGDREKTVQIHVLPPFYKTIWFRFLLISSLLFFAFFIYRYRLNVVRSNFREREIEQERKILNLENEKLESELQKLTFHILNRNRALIEQKKRLIGLTLKAKDSVRPGLETIISQFDEELSDDKDWKYMEPQLDKVYNNFVSKLKTKNPGLTASEIKIAAYVRMNLTTKEISEFMHKTTRAVENDRYRLRKKLGLNTNDSLQHYLLNL